MIAKKIILIINEFQNSSLQVSLQSCQLSSLISLQAQVVSFADCKEQISVNQSIYPDFFASLFAINPN
jgi:hypothetical protein